MSNPIHFLMASFPLNKLDKILEPHVTDHDKIVIKGSNQIPIRVTSKWYLLTSDVNISTTTDLDTGSISNGKDYYVYICDNGTTTPIFKISLASTYPAGYDANSSRKIGGFHTLCVDVGTITGHTLTGYVANDILPASIWDLKHRPVCSPEGMVYDSKIHKWVDIYLASGTGASTQSVYNGVISDTRNWMDFVDDGLAVKKRLLTDMEFQSIAAGSNEETNIFGSADPVTTGGHVDTASRRMISNIGCEDCCGAMWQWLLDQSHRVEGDHDHTENTAATYTQNALTATKDIAVWAWYDLPGSKGSLYRQGTYGDVKFRAGGGRNYGEICGSRSRSASNFRWDTGSDIGGRFLAEPL